MHRRDFPARSRHDPATAHLEHVRDLLRRYPVVGVVGARQVGKAVGLARLASVVEPLRAGR